MEKFEEEQLIKQAATNPMAFAQLYEIYYQKIFNYILRTTFDINTAQDITAETFYKALKNISKFKFTQTGTFQAWIYKIATNEINLYFRKNKKYKFHPTEDMDLFYSQEVPEDEISHALETFDLKSDIKDLQEEISKLDEKYRTIIFLKYFEKKKFSEIAEITGIKEGTLKSHLSRAIDKLKLSMMEKNPTYSSRIIGILIIMSLVSLSIQSIETKEVPSVSNKPDSLTKIDNMNLTAT